MVIDIQIPDSLSIRTLEVPELPGGWDDPIPSDRTKDIGMSWIRDGATAILSVPSSIITRERNYLLNPNHPEIARVTFGAPEPFRFDSRFK